MKLTYEQMCNFINDYVELDKERRQLSISDAASRVTTYRLLVSLLDFGEVTTVRNALQSMIVTEELGLDDMDTPC